MVARRTVSLVGVLAVLLTAILIQSAKRASGDGDACARLASASRDRAAIATGAGPRVVVIGDSWSIGLGLDHAADSWPSRLPGEVHVAAFSGSGFSAHASPCAGASFAERAPGALRGDADLVVIEGGLNDFDRTDAEITAGFESLMAALHGHRIVLVGPPLAPARAAALPRVDALLARLSAEYVVPYVRTIGLGIGYLHDGLHPAVAGQRAFGDFVARRIPPLTGAPH